MSRLCKGGLLCGGTVVGISSWAQETQEHIYPRREIGEDGARFAKDAVKNVSKDLFCLSLSNPEQRKDFFSLSVCLPSSLGIRLYLNKA